MLLIGDEMQDLHEDYMKAVIKITRERYVDFYAVGDKLQSISIEKNAFTFLDKELPKVIEKIQSLTQKGQPVLVGTTTVEESETLARMLKRSKVPHNVLNAKQHQKEAEVITCLLYTSPSPRD